MSPTGLHALHHVRTGPRGHPPLLLLHPAGLDLTYWDNLIAAWKDGHDVIAVDLPGHGRSSTDSGPWTFAAAVEHMIQLMEAMGLARVHLAGISVGGMIAQTFALRHPDRVASLSLIATASEFPAEVRAGMQDRARRLRAGGMPAVIDETIKRWFAPQTIQERPDLPDRATRTLLADDAEVHAQLWEEVSRLDTTTALSGVVAPTLILAGELDPSCPPAASRVMQDRIDGAQLVVLPGTSHMATLERPAAVASHVAAFVDAVDAETRQHPSNED